MRRLVEVTVLALAASLFLSGEAFSEQAREKATLVVFDFPSEFDRGELGIKVAESLRSKALRTGNFVIADPYSVKELTEEAGLEPDFATTPETIINFVKLHGLADLAVWGDVAKSEGGYLIRAKAVDLRRRENQLLFERTEVCKTMRGIPFASQRLVEMLLPAPIPQTPPLDLSKLILGPNLVKNGNFEKGQHSPVHWERIDGLVSFWVEEPAPFGKCILFDTDVYLNEWLAWQHELKAGTARPAPKKTPTRGHKYNTVAGTYGMHLYSDDIPVEKGTSYVLSFDTKGLASGDFMFAKVFVKGYGLVGGERRESYRAYKACRTKTEGKGWEHFERTFSPTKRTPDVKWMRVILYAHWPPGKYYFDNVRICKILGTKAISKEQAPASRHEPDSAGEVSDD